MLAASADALPRSPFVHSLMSIGATLALQNAKRKQCLGRGRHYGAVNIGQRIKELMRARGVTTAAMAKHCGVTAGAVSNWFATGRISKENLVAVCRKLDVPVADLISGTIGARGTPAPLVLSDDERALGRKAGRSEVHVTPRPLLCRHSHRHHQPAARGLFCGWRVGISLIRAKLFKHCLRS